MTQLPDWAFYKADGQVQPETLDEWLKTAPPWRQLPAWRSWTDHVLKESRASSSGIDEVLRINTALYLRRPLLVTGAPGLGKSTLAYHLAWSLGLGKPLRWEINSRTTLKDGLYHYDAVGHLRESQRGDGDASIGDFITLGPLGTALLSFRRPRVLLIDELDKSSFDLPNDLLHVFEEGVFKVDELVRAGEDTQVVPYDPTTIEERATISKGRVDACHHPVVVITNNGEREFPEAFVRRCVKLDLQQPDEARLAEIARAQLGTDVSDDDIAEALENCSGESTDVLLQYLFFAHTKGTAGSDLAQVLNRRRR